MIRSIHQVATSAVWMGAPALVDDRVAIRKSKGVADISFGFRMVNMTINLPLGASLDGKYIVRNGVRIELCRP